MSGVISLIGYWEPVIIFSLINVVLVLGLYITAMSGQISMATAAIAGIGGYAAGVLSVNFGWPFLAGILVATVLAAAVGAALAALTIRMALFVLKLTTLAFGEALLVIAFNTDYLGGANSFTGIPLYTGLGTVLIAVVLSGYLAWRFDGSRLGFAARAVRDDPVAASCMGISVLQIRVITFALGSAVVGAGGAIQAHYMLIMNPQELGFFVSLTYVIFLLVGGMYTPWGPVLGAVLLTAAPEMLRFAKEYRLIVYGAVIVLTIMIRPEGLITRVPTGTASWLTRLRKRLFGLGESATTEPRR